MLACLDDHGHYIFEHHLSSVLRQVTGTMAQMMAAKCWLSSRIRVYIYNYINNNDMYMYSIKFIKIVQTSSIEHSDDQPHKDKLVKQKTHLELELLPRSGCLVELLGTRLPPLRPSDKTLSTIIPDLFIGLWHVVE